MYILSLKKMSNTFYVIFKDNAKKNPYLMQENKKKKNIIPFNKRFTEDKFHLPHEEGNVPSDEFGKFTK